MESFSGFDWSPGGCGDLVASVSFIGILDGGSRLQHFIAPSTTRPGPWTAVRSGPLDLEIAFWPDELFADGAGEESWRGALGRVVAYVLDLRGVSGGSEVVLAHGSSGDPRAWLAGGASALRIAP